VARSGEIASNVCDVSLDIPDEMVPGAVALTGLRDLINRSTPARNQRVGSREGQLLGLAVEDGHDGMMKT
jgi:hypothetical protein